MKLTPSKLRADLYNILDQILETGVPIEIVRKGQSLQISPNKIPDRLSKLRRRKALKGDPQSIVHLDWSKEWTGR